jgi:elongation factor P--(R)-beta-lysine ligase
MSPASRTSDSEDWRPLAGREQLLRRAQLLQGVRGFFLAHSVLEVETPLLGHHTNPDPALESWSVCDPGHGQGKGGAQFLQTSPEFAMKRLLAAGSGPIFQICKAFRGGERGRRHNPEFTLLEWYRPGYSYHRLMDEVAALIRILQADPSLVDERLSYAELFGGRLGVDPHRAEPGELQCVALAQGVSGAEDLALSRDGWLDLLMSHCLEAQLGRGRLCFVYDYPPSQAALARVRDGTPAVAERFELYWEGMELANGFQELTDATEQRRRFLNDQQRRASAGQAPHPIDERFLRALESGMPECAGVALGLDRLLMVMSGTAHLDEVLAFPWERA